MSTLGKRKSVGDDSQRPAKRMTSEEARFRMYTAGEEAVRAAIDALDASEAGSAQVEACKHRMVAAARKALMAARAMTLLLDEARANDGKAVATEQQVAQNERDAKENEATGTEHKEEKEAEQEEKGSRTAVHCPRCRVQNIVPEGIRASSEAVSEMFQCGKCGQCMCLDKIKSE